EPEPLQSEVALHIGLGPGFTAGINGHAVIETRRSHTLGRVYWEGSAQADSRLPGGDVRRVLRAPTSGTIEALKVIGDVCKEGEKICLVNNQPVVSPFDGLLRGLIHPKVDVIEGMKIGDVDHRSDPDLIHLVSDKSLAVAGGVMEVVFTKLANIS